MHEKKEGENEKNGMKIGLMSYTESTAMKNVRAAPVLTLHGENIHLFYTSYENKIKLTAYV